MHFDVAACRARLPAGRLALAERPAVGAVLGGRSSSDRALSGALPGAARYAGSKSHGGKGRRRAREGRMTRARSEPAPSSQTHGPGGQVGERRIDEPHTGRRGGPRRTTPGRSARARRSADAVARPESSHARLELAGPQPPALRRGRRGAARGGALCLVAERRGAKKSTRARLRRGHPHGVRGAARRAGGEPGPLPGPASGPPARARPAARRRAARPPRRPAGGDQTRDARALGVGRRGGPWGQGSNLRVLNASRFAQTFFSPRVDPRGQRLYLIVWARTPTAPSACTGPETS